MKTLLIFTTPLIFVVFLCFTPSYFEKEELVTNPNYDIIKNNIDSERIKLATLYKSAATDEAKKKILSNAGITLTKHLNEKMFPCWYGTEWDFNGYTAIPQEGKIACGYFVSTLLKHAGFNLNRYKLAQQYSLAIVKSLSCGDPILSYHNSNVTQFIQKATPVLKDGLHVVGLDNHVGFILKEKGELFFIHSTFLGPSVVIKEKASESDALKYSSTFVLTSITANNGLIKKWLNSAELQIIK